jgi:pimeloyl-ACP methyl ester carboxylesterase
VDAPLGSSDFRPDLNNVSVPVDIVVGDIDRATPVGLSVQLHRRLPNSHLHVIPDTGHMVALEAPHRLSGIIAAATQRATTLPHD